MPIRRDRKRKGSPFVPVEAARRIRGAATMCLGWAWGLLGVGVVTAALGAVPSDTDNLLAWGSVVLLFVACAVLRALADIVEALGQRTQQPRPAPAPGRREGPPPRP